MEAKPSRINMTLIGSVEKSGGKHFSLRLGIIPVVKSGWKRAYIDTPKKRQLFLLLVLSSLRGESVREGNGNTLASIWTRVELPARLHFFHSVFLNCGDSGMAQW